MSNTDEPELITQQGVQENSMALQKTTNLFLSSFGPSFTGTPKGHIITDIAGASAVTGLMILRSTNIDLSKYEAGTVLLGSGVDEKQVPVLSFISSICRTFGVAPNVESEKDVIDSSKPIFDTLELTKRLEKPFLDACTKANLNKLYYPIGAAGTALKLIEAGNSMSILDPSIGKQIALFYVIAGSKTVPNH